MLNEDIEIIKADVKNIVGRTVVDGKLITSIYVKDVETLCADAYDVDEQGYTTYCGSIQFPSLEELDAKFDEVVEYTRQLYAEQNYSRVN